MELQPGMRVRCHNPGGHACLQENAEYVVQSLGLDKYLGHMVKIKGLPKYSFCEWRFKPIVRVKARSRRVGVGN